MEIGGEKEVEDLTVDLSNQNLKKIERASDDQKDAVTLLLNSNEIQRLDNLYSYVKLKKLCLSNNQLIRMYGVSNLIHLEDLDMSNNMLVTIEGLKDLKQLKYLNLAKNKIKILEHLSYNLNLEKIDLSSNNIMSITDISCLKKLKELKLHENRISHLRNCEKILPSDLEVLTLSDNIISDLNEVSHLSTLSQLKTLSFANNTCINFSNTQKSFNYRPFIKNWCSSLTILDDRELDDIECLKAEWLYSQGRGRSFRSGEHAALVEYLISVCPTEVEKNSENKDVKKLKLILSKAQQHQQQLREQLSIGNGSPSELNESYTFKKKAEKTVLLDRMVTSFQDFPSRDCRQSPELMTQSLDSSTLRNPPRTKIHIENSNQTPLQTSTTFIPIPDTLISPDVGHGLQPFIPVNARPSFSSRTSNSSTRTSPYSTPESKRKGSMNASQKKSDSYITNLWKKNRVSNSHFQVSAEKRSPSRCFSSHSKEDRSSREHDSTYKETSEDDDSEILALKLQALQHRANQKRLKKTNHEEKRKNIKNELVESEAWNAAVCIQRRWRGYRVRNLNKQVVNGFKNIQINRIQDYITKIVSEIEATRAALESNRKLQVLQMQAINALWKKMISHQTNEPAENQTLLQHLVESCSSLNKQVEELQIKVKSMSKFSNSNNSTPVGIQAAVIAVATSQDEARECLLTDAPKPLAESCPSNGSPLRSYLFSDVTKELNSDSLPNATEPVTEFSTKNNLKDVTVSEVPLTQFPEQEDVGLTGENLTKP